MTMRVQKRNGEHQSLDLNKIHKVLEWACGGDEELAPIKGVSVSDVELNAKLHLHDKIKTTDIHKLLIKSAAELISEDTPNYEHMAARLVWFAVRKEAFGENHPPHLRDVIATNLELGFYDPAILQQYTTQEIDTLNGFIDHSRDDLFRYAGAEQMRRKYLTQNRKTKRPTESFQFPYIMVAATLFSSYPKDSRLAIVKEYYDAISTHVLSEPTPVMSGVRTKVRQYSSCVLISSGDELDSINRTAQAIVEYASRKAGLGVDFGRIRAEGQPIRGGEAVSTGVIPFAKYFNAALKSCSQGAVRGASATANYPFWHLEFPNLIELKNEKGTEETRIRTMDYCVHLNRIVFERWAKKESLTLFSPEEVPELWSAFYGADIDNFRAVYEKCERNTKLTKATIPAKDLVEKILAERFETGRIYIMFADTVNRQSPFYEPVTLTNLCTEVTLVTRPLSSVDHTQGRIALCTLGAINVGKVDLATDKGRAKLARHIEIAVRAKDALLSYQDYPMEEARLAVEDYRPLGFGYIGFAHWLARNKLRWGSDETIERVNELAEFISFHLIKTSIQLAKEFGACKLRTRYCEGWMPWDASSLTFEKRMPWDELRADARIYGIRNATLSAFMPSETSSALSNETNGIEPPKKLVTNKDSKDGTLPQLVPEYAKLNHTYETVWNVKCEDYLKTLAPIQHYTDQAISANTSYDPKAIPRDPTTGQVLLSTFAKDLSLAYKLGYKTLYYSNVNDQETIEEDCESGACKI